MASALDWAVEELDNMLTAEKDHTRAAALFTAIRVLMAQDHAPIEPEDRPIEVGDKVRIDKGAYGTFCNGRIGVVVAIDDDDSIARYQVEFPDGHDYEWATTVERVND